MRMTEREELLKRLERVKALAERGVGGEKENAEALLKRLMEKYEISDEDIEDTSTRTYFIRYQTQWERKLLHQIAYMHLGSGHSFGCVGTYTNRSRKKVGVECTPAQYIEIEGTMSFSAQLWKRKCRFSIRHSSLKITSFHRLNWHHLTMIRMKRSTWCERRKYLPS